VSDTIELLKQHKRKTKKLTQERQNEAVKVHSKVMGNRREINGCRLDECSADSKNNSASQRKEKQKGSFKLFDIDTIGQYIRDPIPHKLRGIHEKVRQHSGYVEPRPLPSHFGKVMDEMDASYPHFYEVNQYLRQRMCLYSLQKNPVLHFGSNILLDGPAGVGKSSYLFELSQKFDTLFHSIDCARATNGFDITGMSSKWNGGEPGRLHELLFNNECPNPIILLDEVEKSATDSNHPIEKVLYGLLEPNNARFFHDECVQVPMDASLVNWFGTCNDVEHLSAPLQDRFEVLSVKAPTSDDLLMIIPSLYQSLLKRHKLEAAFAKSLNRNVIECLAMTDGISLRRIRSDLEVALSNAAQRNLSQVKRAQRVRLKVMDIPNNNNKKSQVNSMGFIWSGHV